MQMPVPIAVPTSSAGTASGVVRRRILPIGGRDFLEFSETTLTSRSMLLAVIHADNPAHSGLTADMISVDGVLIGAGGGGGSFGNRILGVWGGFPGAVRQFSCQLSDLSDEVDDIMISIGAGGFAGNPGGDTSFDSHLNSPPAVSLVAPGGIEGHNGSIGAGDVAEQRRRYRRAVVQYGYRGSDVTSVIDDYGMHVSDWFSGGNPRGPGAGGYVVDNAGLAAPTPGGAANSERTELFVFGGFDPGQDGSSGVDGLIESCGSGGAAGLFDEANPIDLDGTGGDGGFPGGGGGAGDGNNGGSGANGVCRLQFSVLEIVE